MTATLQILQAGPMVSVQDFGRAGHVGLGLSTGGAMDRLALMEGAALLGRSKVDAAIEMAGMGGRFQCDAPMRIALTGAQMSANIDGTPARWNATHLLNAGQVLTIGGAISGAYGYLTFAGDIMQTCWLESVSTHIAAGIGRYLAAGDTIPLSGDTQPHIPPQCIAPDARLAGGNIRVMAGPQTHMFDDATIARFCDTRFTRNAQANRTGSRLDHDGTGFTATLATSPVSDFVTCGDIQMTGDGVPFVLLTECQTIGGYPRIGTIIDTDRPRMAQLQTGAEVQFAWVSLQEAARLYQTETQTLTQIRSKVRPLVRNPADIHDLLSYQLISGVTCGDDLERDL
ncbi:5-oxoprolinase subunit C family protein [Yoonia sp. MH D7]